MRFLRFFLLSIAVALVAFTVRLPGLGTFMTVDEENWVIRSSGFYHNLFQKRDPGGTFMTTHPGATAMWLIGAGVVWQESRVGVGADTSTVQHFRVAATLPLVVATSVLVGVATFLLSRLWGAAAAFWSGLFVAVEPYVVGMSQIAHLDALLALLMLCSMLSFFLYLSVRYQRLLVLSGVFAGFAVGVKLLPALWLFVFFGGLLVISRGWRFNFSLFRRCVAELGFLVGVSALVFWMVWPALWFTDDLNRSFNRDVPSVFTQEHVALEVSEEPIAPASFYGRTVLGRATPFALILSLAGVIVLIRHVVTERGRLDSARSATMVVWLVLYTIGFLLLITFVAKKADRYALPALVMLPVIAGWVWSKALPLFKHWGVLFSLGRVHVLLGIVVGASVVTLPLLWSPYTIAYSNPLFGSLRPLSQQGWGEGLDAAARWLNDHPFIDHLTVASWYPRVMRAYFHGTTMSLSSRDDNRVGFVVTYRNMGGRAPDDIASNVLDEFRDRVPVHVVSIQGVAYVWIYNVMQPTYFQQHVGELVGGMEVGQVLPITSNNWDRLAIGFATFSGRANTEDVYLSIRDSIDASEDLRTVVVNARDIEDEAWHTFTFDPLPDSGGKTYYVALSSPSSRPGNAVTVRFTTTDVLPGEVVLRRRPLQSGEHLSDFIRDGDLAYRLGD